MYVAKFSPRDSLVASAGLDRTLRLWEGAYPYSQVACLEGHRQLISDLCWAPDGRSLLSASFDQVWGSVVGYTSCTSEMTRSGVSFVRWVIVFFCCISSNTRLGRIEVLSKFW